MLNQSIFIRLALKSDIDAICKLDFHLTQAELNGKIDRQQVIVAIEEDRVVGVLRFNFFWDQIPFLNFIFVETHWRKQGVGLKLMKNWEERMISLGNKHTMTSTQADELAQHFYRKLGYMDVGGFVLPNDPMELIFYKQIG